MEKTFDLSQFDEYREDNRREVKKANGGLPISLWDTYSAFANCYGGIIILGVKEEKDGSWKTTGLQNASKLRKDFWDTINNSKKVNINLLSEDDVEMYEVGDNKDVIMVIYVPMAKREQKPVYINNDIFNGTFRRNYEGDYHCTRLQVKTMLSDQTERTMDMEVLDKVPMEDLNYDTIHGYRNRHRSLKEEHPFERLSDHEYLRSIGAAAISEEDGRLHPTAAGMLMFGDEYNIVRHFPEYFWTIEKSWILPLAGVTDCSPVPVNGPEMCVTFILEFITRSLKILRCLSKWSVENVLMILRYTRHSVKLWQTA